MWRFCEKRNSQILRYPFLIPWKINTREILFIRRFYARQSRRKDFAHMVATGGETGLALELFQFVEQFPILVELWTVDARVPRNTRGPATLVVRIMQIKLVCLVCAEALRQMSSWLCSSVLGERHRIPLVKISLFVLRIHSTSIGISPSDCRRFNDLANIATSCRWLVHERKRCMNLNLWKMTVY